MACAHCGAESGHFYDCPESRFARIERTHAAPPAVAAPIEAPGSDTARVLAVPIALVVMLLLVHTGVGGFVTRLCFAMPLHELGHAVSSWFTGATAMPLLWFTPMGETRSPLLIVLELAALGVWAWHSRRSERPSWPVMVVASLLGVGLLLPSHSRLAFVTFGGDAGALVFGSALMAAVLLPDGLRLTRGGLRWGYLVIGAGAYANVASEWFSAWRDVANINFGNIEGVGLSDASKLVDLYGWSERRLVMSYLSLSALCLAALATLLIVRMRTPLTARFARKRQRD